LSWLAPGGTDSSAIKDELCLTWCGRTLFICAGAITVLGDFDATSLSSAARKSLSHDKDSIWHTRMGLGHQLTRDIILETDLKMNQKKIFCESF
jgi:hypothetical protein